MATAAPGPGDGAIASQNGVQMVAAAGAWKGQPAALSNQLTPIRVTITNRSSEPVLVAYNEFRLVSDKGRRYSAVPPFRIDGKVKRVVNPDYTPIDFGYAPYYTAYYPNIAVAPYLPNQRYWDRFGPLMTTVNLPTDDMLRKALPEGTLRPGGQVSGFLYFEGVGDDVDRVRLVADFERARDKGLVAKLQIPFVVS